MPEAEPWEELFQSKQYFKEQWILGAKTEQYNVPESHATKRHTPREYNEHHFSNAIRAKLTEAQGKEGYYLGHKVPPRRHSLAHHRVPKVVNIDNARVSGCAFQQDC